MCMGPLLSHGAPLPGGAGLGGVLGRKSINPGRSLSPRPESLGKSLLKNFHDILLSMRRTGFGKGLFFNLNLGGEVPGKILG